MSLNRIAAAALRGKVLTIKKIASMQVEISVARWVDLIDEEA